MIERNCQQCGAPFTVEYPCRKRRFCNYKCSSTWLWTEGPRAKDRTKYSERECPTCGSHFQRPVWAEQTYCSLDCVPRTGEHNGNWNGGISHTATGRKLKMLPDGRTMLYSRWLMQEHLGRELEYNEVVHHINGDPTDDRIENFAVLTRAAHMDHHRRELAEGAMRAVAV